MVSAQQVLGLTISSYFGHQLEDEWIRQKGLLANNALVITAFFSVSFSSAS
jgi:hypothetical protein